MHEIWDKNGGYHSFFGAFPKYITLLNTEHI